MARLSASASNIANADSIGAAPAAAASQGASASTSATRPTAYQPVRAQLADTSGGGVQATLGATSPTYRLVYEPSSSAANADGMVAAPNVDVADEMVEQMSAAQDFKANLKVVQTVDLLQRQSFEVWG